jgi:hypothetical protein
MKLSLSRLPLLMLLVAAGATACTASTDEGAQGEEDDLTSLTARSRKLDFIGTVYVSENAPDYEVMGAVKQQTQSAFGALRTAKVGVNSRELKDVDPSTFKKSAVEVVDPANRGAAPKKMTKVVYEYTDNALVPTTMATRSALPLAVLGKDYQSQNSKILTECTDNDSEAHEFEGQIWYVFNPSLSQCKDAMTAEQKKIDADHQGLANNQVPQSEVTRLYVPVTMALKNQDQNTKPKYPEYDRLYSGGVENGKLVIGMVSGLMADWAAGEHHDTFEDEGYDMWFQGLREIFKARPGFQLKSVDPSADLLSYKVGDVDVKFASFDDVIAFELDSQNPAGVTDSNRDALRKMMADTIVKHWITFEVPVNVTISGTSKPLTIKLQSYFGAETDSTPHKRAIKTSDVFVYNGHSYIGYGPLDPSHFTAADFPPSYQIMTINGCVSYNYYEKDYFPLKQGGTANMELITNGLESWVNESGPAMGRLVGSLIDGKMNSYQDVLKAAQFTEFGYDWGMDALRVVDGELDNKWTPASKPITIQ